MNTEKLKFKKMNSPTQSFGLRLEEPIAKEVKETADSEGLSKNNLLARIIEDWYKVRKGKK